MKLLRIDASPRSNGSPSRELADAVVRRWRSIHPQGEVVERDLATNPVPHVDEDSILSFQNPDAPSLAQSDLSLELIAELRDADELVISTPLHNFSIPSVLKAWIDHVVRRDHTFTVTPEGEYRGLLKTECVWAVTAPGTATGDGPLAELNHVGPYLENLFRFLGAHDVKHVGVETTAASGDAFQISRDLADRRLRELLGRA